MGFRYLIAHISVVAQEEMRVGYALVCTLSNGFRCEIRQEQMNSFHRLELPVHYILTYFVREDFYEIGLWHSFS